VDILLSVVEDAFSTTTTTTTQKRRLPPCVEGSTLSFTLALSSIMTAMETFSSFSSRNVRDTFPERRPNDEDENISFLSFLSSSFDASRETRQNAIFFFFFFFFTRNDTARDAIDERTHQRKKTRLYFPR
jgi:hypothetical protein